MSVSPSGGPEPVSRCRRFNIGDGMILCAAFAIWLAPTLDLLDMELQLAHVSRSGSLVAVIRGNLPLLLGFASLAGMLLASCFAWAYLAIRFRQPRPGLRQILRQPGITAWLLIIGLAVLPSFVRDNMKGRDHVPPTWLAVVSFVLIVGSYAGLSYFGWPRPERGWIDRLGRSLAALWCLAASLVMILETWRFF